MIINENQMSAQQAIGDVQPSEGKRTPVSNLKEWLSYGMAAASLVAGFVLLFMGYCAPPEGEIDSSVLYAFGEISIFVGSVLGISVHCAGELKRIKKA